MKIHPVHLAAVVGLAAVLACGEEATPGGEGGSGGGGEAQFSPDLLVRGFGYSPHNGKRMFGIVIDSRNGTVVGARQVVVVQDGSFTLEWPGILIQGVPYNLDMFAGYDNDNDVCEPPDTDHVWRHPFRDSQRKMGVLELRHTAGPGHFTPEACESFE